MLGPRDRQRRRLLEVDCDEATTGAGEVVTDFVGVFCRPALDSSHSGAEQEQVKPRILERKEQDRLGYDL